MLCFDIRSLESQAVQVDGELAADDAVWESEGPRPAGPVRVTGRLSSAGAGRFYFSGRLEGTVAGECRFCLTDVTAPVAEEVHLFFAEEGDETAEDDPDVYPMDTAWLTGKSVRVRRRAQQNVEDAHAQPGEAMGD